MAETVLLGDEAVALGAVHAGLTAAYGYPGTPSTEILEYLVRYSEKHPEVKASWCANEKTSYEEALGVSYAGRRTIVTMKHVGLNVAADPFVNSALLGINGGLVVAVADDPGMHSSQDEQDTRWLADFARVICLEPTSAQEAYDMTREAFDLSEKHQVPVIIRLVTRLAHARAVVNTSTPRPQNALKKSTERMKWTLLPSYARRQWTSLLDRQVDFLKYSQSCRHNTLELNEKSRDVGIITTGLARNYFLENLDELAVKPSHLHISFYPMPDDMIRKLVKHVRRVVVLEEGYPYVERQLRGIISPEVEIWGRMAGEVPREGELSPDNVRKALGLSERKTMNAGDFQLPGRAPQLCKGCPHCDMYQALNEVLKGYEQSVVHSDIGCYTLGALPPYSTIESCVCMGASVGLARGSADAGLHPSIAVIGDSTFLHGGVTPLMDVISAKSNMTLLILDNAATAMTGGQPTLLPQENIENLIRGIGIDPEHLRIVEAHRKNHESNKAVIKAELDYRGPSVIIARRECLETARKKPKTQH